MNQDKEDEALISSLECDTIEVSYLLLEPQDYVSIYGLLGARENSPKNNMNIDHNLSTTSDNIVNSEVFLHEQTLVHTKPNEALVDNFQVNNDLISTCEDYLLDVEYEVSSDVETESSKETQGLICKSQNPVNSPSEAINNIHSITNQDYGSYYDTNAYTMHTFDNINDVSTLDKDETEMFFYPNTSTSQGTKIESEFKEYTLSNNTVLNPKTKRSRKPTRRYVEESVDPVLTSYKKRKSKDKIVKDKYKNGIINFIPEELSVQPIQVPFGPIINRECNKSHALALVKVPEIRSVPEIQDSEDEYTTMSEEESKIRVYKSRSSFKKDCNAPRKHHKLWTITEVKELIDGVAQYGVGKWSDIKHHYFTESTHRTSVDLKDKWRNLLKASRLQTGVSENKRNQSWRPLPKAILNRVIELSSIYPYPRILKSKVSHVEKSISSLVPNNGKYIDAVPKDSGNMVIETSLGNNDFACLG